MINQRLLKSIATSIGKAKEYRSDRIISLSCDLKTIINEFEKVVDEVDRFELWIIDKDEETVVLEMYFGELIYVQFNHIKLNRYKLQICKVS